MKRRTNWACTALVPIVGLLGGCAETGVTTATGPADRVDSLTATSIADEDLARLLVKLELRTRAVIAGHYVGADEGHRAWMVEHLLLPAAVADSIFHEIVPRTTGDRAWVKMVVEQPRNANNRGDTTALALLGELKEGENTASKRLPDSFYHAEPIKAAATCLACHGEPKGDPDPFFPQYKKNGWKAGATVGAVVARVGRGGCRLLENGRTRP